MPTMAEYAKSGGYAKDAKISSNFSKVSFPKSSSSSSSSKSKSSSPSGYMGVPKATVPVPQSGAYTPGPANWNSMTQAQKDAQIGNTIGPGMMQKGTSQQVKTAVPGSWPVPMDMNAINSYVDKQINTKLTAAENAANATRTTAQTDASQSTSLLDNQLAQAVARLQAARQQAATGVQSGFDRAQAMTKDNRVLQDQSFQRQANPFSGQTSYQQTMMGREREISDRQQSEDLTSRLGAINQDALNQQGAVEQDVGARKAAIQQNLTNLQSKIATDLEALKNATGAEKERLTREITKDERNYRLQLQEQNRADVMTQAQLKQNEWLRGLEESKFKQGVDSDLWNRDFKVGESVRDQFNYEDEKTYKREQDQKAQDEQRRQGNIALAQWGMQQFGFGQPKSDAGVFFEQYAGVPTLAAQKLAEDASQMGFENAIKKALAENTISQSQANLAIEQAQLKIQQQNANTSASNASRSASNAAESNQLARERFEYEKSQQPKQNANQVEGDIMGRLNQMTPDMQRSLLTNEEANLVSMIGRTAYNALRKRYLGEE